jgi:hypothetical protein
MRLVNLQFMLHLFRRKMIYVVKYFRRNHFQEKKKGKKKDFLQNIFWRLARTKKLQNVKIRVWQMPPESGNVWSPLPDSGMTLPDPVISRRIWRQSRLDSSHFGQIRPASDHGRNPTIFRTVCDKNLVRRILATGCSRTSAPVGFRRSTIAEFRQSNIKRACNDKLFNFKKTIYGENRKSFSKN